MLGVFNANDLLNVNVYFEMINSLIVEFEKNTLILDCEQILKLSIKRNKIKISKFNNPLEWYKIKKTQTEIVLVKQNRVQQINE
jgi:hypothetical protein